MKVLDEHENVEGQPESETGFESDMRRVWVALKALFPNPLGQSPHDKKRNNLQWLLHSMMNVPVEATRRDPQLWTKIYLGAIVVLVSLYYFKRLID